MNQGLKTMLRLVNNVKEWFVLYYLKENRMIPLGNTIYPLDYNDSRFHRAYERILNGAIPIHVDTRKKIQIDYKLADSSYNDGYPMMSEPFSIDLSFLDRMPSKLKNGIKLSKEIVSYKLDVNEDLLYKKTIDLINKGKRVPSYLRKFELIYWSNVRDARNSRNQSPDNNGDC